MFSQFSGSKSSMFTDTPSSSYMLAERSYSSFNPESHNNPQIRHSEVNEGVQPEYVAFQDLPHLSENCNVEQLLAHIKHRFEAPQDWYPYFEAITDVRSLYRNLPNMVEQIMACFCHNLINSLYHRKSCVVKNALVAFCDFYDHAAQYPITYAYTYQVLNSLVSKAMSPNKTYQKLGSNAINSLICSNFGDQLLQQLCEIATNINLKVGAIGFQTLTQALNNSQSQISTLDQKTNQMIFKTISHVLDKQTSGQLKLFARNILKFYVQVMGQNNFLSFLQFMVTGGFMTHQEASLVFSAADKPDKVTYPRLSLEVQKIKQTYIEYRQSTAV